MALIVEDGTGLANAQSYIDVAYADSYFTLRANTVWSAVSNKEALIIKAMDYFEAVYGDNIKGYRLVETQALSFPRVIDGETVYTDRLKNAICELALKANDGDLLTDIERQTVKEEVGPIKVTYSEYADQVTKYALVYNLIKPYLAGSSYSMKVERT